MRLHPQLQVHGNIQLLTDSIYNYIPKTVLRICVVTWRATLSADLCQMQGVDGGGVKNTYTEDYAEQNGLRLWTPKPDDIRFKENDVTIKLRFRSEECGDVIAARDAFYNYVAGKKLEWYDTFRKKYLQLCLIEAPTIEYEKLTGSQYCVMSYKFKNFGGKPYTSSQL